MGNSFSFEVSHQYIFSLIYLSIFGSVFGFSLYLTLIKKLGSNDAAYVAIIMPLVALVVSTFFEELVWDVSLVLGAIMIVLGNVIILKRN
jgi:drug/metabolite transporter (DMT)-like permease